MSCVFFGSSAFLMNDKCFLFLTTSIEKSTVKVFGTTYRLLITYKTHSAKYVLTTDIQKSGKRMGGVYPTSKPVRQLTTDRPCHFVVLIYFAFKKVKSFGQCGRMEPTVCIQALMILLHASNIMSLQKCT